MAKRLNKTETSPRKYRPAKDPEERENQLIALAVDLAERQLSEGTASAQVITHYLKLATMKERLELESLKQEIQLKEAKTEAIQSAKNMEKLYSEALRVMSIYRGVKQDD